MRELVLAAAVRGHAVRIHTIGDAAVSEAISIFEEAEERYGAPTQGANTIEHVEDIRPDDIGRMARAGVVASVQPPHVTIDTVHPDRDLGPERWARMFPFKGFLDADVAMAFGTDAPVVPPSPGDVLYTAVTRLDPKTHSAACDMHPEHAPSIDQALRAYTAGSAAAVGRSREMGTLDKGKLADLVVWDRDLLSCEAGELQESAPVATFVGGRAVFEG